MSVAQILPYRVRPTVQHPILFALAVRASPHIQLSPLLSPIANLRPSLKKAAQDGCFNRPRSVVRRTVKHVTLWTIGEKHHESSVPIAIWR